MQTYNQQQTEDVNGYDQVTQPAPDARDFLGSQYLAKEDIEGETVARLTSVEAATVQSSQRRKLVASFEGFEKRLILNATNIRRLSAISARQTRRCGEVMSSSTTTRWSNTLASSSAESD